MEEIKITIVGAGALGLAIGYELSKYYPDIFILEKNPAFGQEASSRNSEVIHAGIYYPQDSLKAKTCLEGKHLIYEFCRNFNIAHKKLGKLIVATKQDEIEDLEGLLQNARKNGIDDLTLLDKKEIQRIEPQITALAAIHSPSTGIFDTHSFMKALSSGLVSCGGQIAYNTELIAAKTTGGKIDITVRDNKEGEFGFSTQTLINCAGLNSERIAKLIGLNRQDYKIKYCKGDYFRVSAAKSRRVNRLVYPIPKTTGAGLGIHATPDLTGSLRLGPDDQYIKEIDYNIDNSKSVAFASSVRPFLPFIEPEDLNPDTSGIRPKLAGPNEGFRDFLIKDETESGFPGLINLIGIESPGLTSSLSIARQVRNLVDKHLL